MATAATTVPLLAWQVAVKWFRDNGTQEKEKERERERPNGPEKRAAAKTKKGWEGGREGEGREC